MKTKKYLLLAIVLLAFMGSKAWATTIYFADNLGNVGQYDSVTTQLASVGSLTGQGYSIGQVIGIAYDPIRNNILILDRSTQNVYDMNPLTGIASVLFSPNFNFQGGAVLNDILYGIDENAQTIEGFSLSTFTQVVNGTTALPYHTHAMGVDTIISQLFTGTGINDGISMVNPDGTYGSQIITTIWLEDLDPFGNVFLGVDYNFTVFSIDGLGATSTFLTSSQVASVGVTSRLSGVVVAGAAPIPEPATLLLLGSGIVGLIGFRKKFRKK